MTAPTMPGLEEAIEAAWDRRIAANEPSFSVRLDDGLTDIGFYFTKALWDRDSACDEAECPNRAAWDQALDAVEPEAMQAAKVEAIALIKQHMVAFAVTFQREHPEAVLREVDDEPEADTSSSSDPS
ncbi:MAG: hypothetical protein ACC726_12590 [Chloroflexota bacterium]